MDFKQMHTRFLNLVNNAWALLFLKIDTKYQDISAESTARNYLVGRHYRTLHKVFKLMLNSYKWVRFSKCMLMKSPTLCHIYFITLNSLNGIDADIKGMGVSTPMGLLPHLILWIENKISEKCCVAPALCLHIKNSMKVSV